MFHDEHKKLNTKVTGIKQGLSSALEINILQTDFNCLCKIDIEYLINGKFYVINSHSICCIFANRTFKASICHHSKKFTKKSF